MATKRKGSEHSVDHVAAKKQRAQSSGDEGVAEGGDCVVAKVYNSVGIGCRTAHDESGSVEPQNVKDLEGMSFKELGKYAKVYFKAILGRWEEELTSRSTETKNSGRGRAATQRFKESKGSMKAYFKDIRAGTMHIDVVGGISKIVFFLKTREYIKAHDQYMLMAIGNSPWPIGVTAVGIHSRGARDRIGANKIAHIMDNEGTRRALNAVKRVMTYVQKIFPTDPSKMVFS